MPARLERDWGQSRGDVGFAVCVRWKAKEWGQSRGDVGFVVCEVEGQRVGSVLW